MQNILRFFLPKKLFVSLTQFFADCLRTDNTSIVYLKNVYFLYLDILTEMSIAEKLKKKIRYTIFE